MYYERDVWSEAAWVHVCVSCPACAWRRCVTVHAWCSRLSSSQSDWKTLLVGYWHLFSGCIPPLRHHFSMDASFGSHMLSSNRQAQYVSWCQCASAEWCIAPAWTPAVALLCMCWRGAIYVLSETALIVCLIILSYSSVSFHYFYSFHR